jgi:hypothetical protein
MKTIVLSVMFLSYGFVFCQSKKEDRKEKREQKKEEKERYRVLEAQRNNLITEINAQQKQVVLYASYNSDFNDIYSAMYQVVSSEYNSIQKESESRGYIDAFQESDLQKEWLTAEIKGKEGTYKVSFIAKGQKRTKNKETGVYSEWTNYSIGDNYYTILHSKLYKQLIGEVPLTADLLKRIEEFNNNCEWVNLDLIKGKNY